MSAPDFTTVQRNAELCRRVPAIAVLDAEMLANLWHRMPAGNLPKAHIFAAGVALAIEAFAQMKESA